jgi:hypothetical protein
MRPTLRFACCVASGGHNPAATASVVAKSREVWWSQGVDATLGRSPKSRNSKGLERPRAQMQRKGVLFR